MVVSYISGNIPWSCTVAVAANLFAFNKTLRRKNTPSLSIIPLRSCLFPPRPASERSGKAQLRQDSSVVCSVISSGSLARLARAVTADFSLLTRQRTEGILCVFQGSAAKLERKRLRDCRRHICQDFPTLKKAKRGCFTYGETAPLTGYLLQAELLVEAFNTTASVNQLLLAGIERVTLGADFNSDILLSRPGLEHGTTSAANGGLLIIGMDSLLHVCSPLSVSSQGAKRPQNLKPDYYTMAFPRLQPQNSIFFLADPRKSTEFPLDFCRNCGLLPTPVPCTI